MKITADSHTDHALTPAHLAWIVETFGDLDAFAIRTVTMPAHLSDLPCALHGPCVGGLPILERDVFYRKRGERVGESRMVVGESRPSRWLTVIVGPHDGEIILFTAFGGPMAPREPFDPALADRPDEHAESVAFWGAHALATECPKCGGVYCAGCRHV